MSWPETWRHWGEQAHAPAIEQGGEVVVRLLRVVFPRPVGLGLRGVVVRRAGAPPANVAWRVRVGCGQATYVLTHSSSIQEELEPGEYRLISGANLTQIQLPAESIEVEARIRATTAPLADGDVRCAAWLAPLGALTWNQGEDE